MKTLNKNHPMYPLYQKLDRIEEHFIDFDNKNEMFFNLGFNACLAEIKADLLNELFEQKKNARNDEDVDEDEEEDDVW